jgi:hypothetical protein
MRTNIQNINADFICKHCGRYVSTCSALSGVVHRNHCPCCLHSRHVDLFEAGDRLCACKSLMAPVGLTLKRSRDKYTNRGGGELMLVHRCTQCGGLSINRIAADDDPTKILVLVEGSSEDSKNIQQQCVPHGIQLLESSERRLVLTRLFGKISQTSYQQDRSFQSL